MCVCFGVDLDWSGLCLKPKGVQHSFHFQSVFKWNFTTFIGITKTPSSSKKATQSFSGRPDRRHERTLTLTLFNVFLAISNLNKLLCEPEMQRFTFTVRCKSQFWGFVLVWCVIFILQKKYKKCGNDSSIKMCWWESNNEEKAFSWLIICLVWCNKK